jgi:hypothetical protein
MPDKLRAIEQLAKLCGWNGSEKFERRKKGDGVSQSL